jgi:phosphoribosylaminoimidazole-succinocarboxamide synthase
MTPLMQTNIEGFPVRRGKVRDIYELGANMLVIITTDRISAFDAILPTGIPDKGKILTQMSLYWAEELETFYHNISTDLNQMPEAFRKPELEGRTMLVERAEVIPFECVVRGYLCGSGWKDYQKTGEICGIKLPKGLKENQQFPYPIFTPATKAETGHDENISLQYMIDKIGIELALELEQRSIELYTKAATKAWYEGIIIADTKFEFGRVKHLNGDLCLIDEVMTCDSSRFWPLSAYKLEGSIPSWDKQYVRDWLSIRWNKEGTPPELPDDVVENTRRKYIEGYEKITGRKYE